MIMEEANITVASLLATGIVASTTTSAILGLPSEISVAENSNSSATTISEEDELKLLNFPSKQEDLTTAIPLTVIFALLLATGCIGNLCTAIVIAKPKNKYMHTATNYYLFSLAMSDFLFLILGLPQEMYTLWQRYPYAFGESFCVIRGYLSEASTYASILTISAFTIERYVAICHPLWAHTMSQLPRAITSIVVIWCLAAICAIPPAAELGIVTQRGPVSNRTLEQSAQCATKRHIYENMFAVSAIVFFIVPMIIVTVLYILIALELRRSSKMNSAFSKQTPSTSSNNNNNNNSSKHYSAATSSHHNHHYQIHHHNHHHNHHHRHQLPNHCRTGNHSQHTLALNQKLVQSHLKSVVSQSQQQVSCFSPSSSQPAASSMPQSHGHEHEQQQAIAKQSLMASIMSQRPSSAIGTEMMMTSAGSDIRAPEACASKQTTPARILWLWPLSWANPAASQRHPAYCCCLEASRKCARLQPSFSHQLPGSRESLARQLSPLSYHESLIQRNHNQRNHQQEPSTAPIERLLLPSQQNTTSTSLGGANNYDNHDDSDATLHEPSSERGAATSHSAANRNQRGHHHHHRHQHQHRHHHNRHRHHHRHHNHCHGDYHGHHHHHHYHHRSNLQLAQQSQNGVQSSHRRPTAASSKKSVVRMLVAVVVSFFICWVPFHAQRLLASYLNKHENQDNQVLLDIYLKLTYISGVTYYLSSTINPLLYQLMSAKFRLAFKETFKCSLLSCAAFAHHRRPSAGHSPTNSLREATTNNTNPHNQQQPQTPNLQQPNNLVNRCAYLQSHHQLSTGDFSKASCQQLAFQDACSCSHLEQCSISSDLTGSQVQHQYHHSCRPGSVLARLKGKLNTSLVSLFRLNSNELSSASQNCCSPSAACNMLPNDSRCAYSSQTGSRQLQEACGCSVTPLGRPEVAPKGGQLSACASTPLLADQGGHAGETSVNNCREPIGAHFVAHSMLKFIKVSPSAASNMNSQQTQASLTRLSSRDEEEQQQQQQLRPSGDQKQHRKQMDSDQFASVEIRQPMEALIKPTPIGSELDEQQHQPLVMTSTSESSAGSSPDQLHVGSTDCRLQRCVGHKLSSGSTSSAGSALNSHGAARRRRASFQQFGANQGERNGNANCTATGARPSAKLKRRLSISSIASDERQQQHQRYQQQHRQQYQHQRPGKQLSSSISSSDRQLDKKLSMSTTTSALDDCGSFATTNSQLTNNCASSNQALARAQSSSLASGDNSSPSAIEEDPSTVINLNAAEQRFGFDLETESLVANEVKLPLLSAAASVAGGGGSMVKKPTAVTGRLRNMDTF